MTLRLSASLIIACSKTKCNDQKRQMHLRVKVRKFVIKGACTPIVTFGKVIIYLIISSVGGMHVTRFHRTRKKEVSKTTELEGKNFQSWSQWWPKNVPDSADKSEKCLVNEILTGVEGGTGKRLSNLISILLQTILILVPLSYTEPPGFNQALSHVFASLPPPFTPNCKSKQN